jgi:hypothetical protein
LTNPAHIPIQHVDPEHAMYQDCDRGARIIQPRAAKPGNFTGSFAEKCEWMRQKQARKKRAYRRREP